MNYFQVLALTSIKFYISYEQLSALINLGEVTIYAGLLVTLASARGEVSPGELFVYEHVFKQTDRVQFKC